MCGCPTPAALEAVSISPSWCPWSYSHGFLCSAGPPISLFKGTALGELAEQGTPHGLQGHPQLLPRGAVRSSPTGPPLPQSKLRGSQHRGVICLSWCPDSTRTTPPPLVHTHTPLRGPLSGSETQRQGPGLSVLGGASVPQPPPAPRTWPTLCPALSRTPQEVQGFTVPQELVDTYPSPLRWDDAGVGPTRLSQLPQQDWLQLPTVVGVCAPTLELVLEA